MSKTTYLLRVNQTYYFRCRIPLDLQEMLPWKEFKRSLKTESLTNARKLLKVWCYKAEHVFTLLRSGVLTEEQARSLASEFIDKGLRTGTPGDQGNQGADQQRLIPVKVTSQEFQLSKIVETYIQEYKTTEKASGPSIYEIETKCWLFVRVAGDMDIREVTRDTVIDFLKVLKKLPKNMSKFKVYDGKSIEEVLAMQPKDTLSDTTINNYLVRVNSFFTWAVRVGYIGRNPAEGVRHGRAKLIRADELRKAYGQDDLKKLVAGYSCLTQDEKAKLKGSPDRFWIPLISLYSGLRLNEICQLNTDDVKQDEETGVWYFHVEVTEGDDKMIKSAAARRKIPVHNELIDLGLLRYCQSMTEKGVSRLWMNLKQTNRGYHKNFVNWFLGNGVTLGFLRSKVTEDKKLNFHSFRHTFINELKQKMVDGRILIELAGHSNKSMTFGRYGKPYGLKDKLVVNMLDFQINIQSLQRIAEIKRDPITQSFEKTRMLEGNTSSIYSSRVTNTLEIPSGLYTATAILGFPLGTGYVFGCYRKIDKLIEKGEGSKAAQHIQSSVIVCWFILTPNILILFLICYLYNISN
jgi:integrase